jgi:surfeit locus 1 family protein
MQTAQQAQETRISAGFRLPGPTTFFNRQWWWTTLLVLLCMAILVRLGLWQLDRLEQRRAYNADVVAKLALPPISLNDEDLPADLDGLKNRSATVQGAYDFSQQVALLHQHWMNTPGFHLVTPLVMDDGARSGDLRPRAVLVDRGWLPAGELAPENWSLYDLVGASSVTGYIKLTQSLAGSEDAGQTLEAPQAEWYRVDVEAIEAQLPYELLPVYLQQAPPSDGSAKLPFRGELEPDLSDGPHLSYAIQWFIFAAILALGYVLFVGKRVDSSR